MSLYSILKMLSVVCSVGSPFPSNQPRPYVHLLRGWFTAPLGDIFTVRSALFPTRYLNANLTAKRKSMYLNPLPNVFFFFLNHSVTRHGTVNNFSTLNYSIPSLMFHQCVSREQKQQYDLSQCYAISWRKPVHHQRLAERRLQ